MAHDTRRLQRGDDGGCDYERHCTDHVGEQEVREPRRGLRSVTVTQAYAPCWFPSREDLRECERRYDPDTIVLGSDT